MKTSFQKQTYGQALLAQAPVCNALANSYTHDPVKARQLTIEVITWVWHGHDAADTPSSIKVQLFAEMHRLIPLRLI
jgi:hypothetical protein